MRVKVDTQSIWIISYQKEINLRKLSMTPRGIPSEPSCHRCSISANLTCPVRLSAIMSNNVRIADINDFGRPSKVSDDSELTLPPLVMLPLRGLPSPILVLLLFTPTPPPTMPLPLIPLPPTLTTPLPFI